MWWKILLVLLGLVGLAFVVGWFLREKEIAKF